MINFNDLKTLFNNYLNNCYYVVDSNKPTSIFMYYDVNYVRKQKLAQLEGEFINKTDITGACLFQLELSGKWFYINYNYFSNLNNFKNPYDFHELETVLKELMKERSIIFHQLYFMSPVNKNTEGYLEVISDAVYNSYIKIHNSYINAG